MKRKLRFFTLTYGLFILILVGCKSESDGFLVTGTINDQNGNIIYLKYDDKVDSTEIVNNSFRFEGNVKAPVEAFIQIDKNSNTPWLLGDHFMLENSRITMNLKYWNKAKEDEIREWLRVQGISGSNTQKRLDAYRAKMDISFNKEENDSLKKEALYNVLQEFLVANPKLKIAGDNLLMYASNYREYLDIEKTEHLYSLLDTIYQEKEVLDRIKVLLKQRKHLVIGSKAPEFKLKNRNGEEFILKENTSEFILIDFWASWCLPCRWQHPELVKLYKNYQRKGLEIVSISLDEDLKAWEKAIEKDSMTWINLSDSNRNVADKYYMYQIPMTVLIDSTGNIIAKDLDIFSYDDPKPSFATILDSYIDK